MGGLSVMPLPGFAAHFPVVGVGVDVTLPDDWEPIPAPEVAAFVERLRLADPAHPAANVDAAFQRKPVTVWFALPHLLTHWVPDSAVLPKPLSTDDATGGRAVSSAADHLIAARTGRSRQGVIYNFDAAILRHNGVLLLQYHSATDDEQAVRAAVDSLREAPPPP